VSTLVLPKVAVSLPQLGVRERVACHKPAAAKKMASSCLRDDVATKVMSLA
jgi:hypothetical protein